MKFLKKIIKKIPLINWMLFYFFGTIIQTGKKNSTFFTYNSFFKENKNDKFNITKINKSNSLYKDRQWELIKFFKINKIKLFFHYLINGTPNTTFYKYKMAYYFKKYGTEKDKLKKTYKKISFMYTNRLLFKYHNYNIGLKIMEINDRLLKLDPEKTKILDYGCGIADPSILLSLNNYNVTIADLDDKKFEFAKFRCKIRNLKIQPIGINQTEEPINLDKKFDFIIMAEFLEHVRNPLIFLKFAIDHLKKGGILYDSLGAIYGHRVGGDHLKEAKELMENNNYKDFFEKNFYPLNKKINSDQYEHFYIKK